MGTCAATVVWQRAPDERFVDNRYSRAHEWWFDGGTVVGASSSPQIVRLPFSRADAVDPEEAFVASLSSCHMLGFLSFAAADGHVVDRYEDDAVGELGTNAAGADAMLRVILRPSIDWAGTPPTPEAIAGLHHRAHDACFIANSVITEVTVEPAIRVRSVGPATPPEHGLPRRCTG
jgi:organic hydroperoxide reductase OsmC/OhrA